MPTFGQRVAERLEEVAGVSVRPTRELHAQELEYQRTRALADEAEDLALGVMDYMGDGGRETVSYEKRQELSARSRLAFIRDPLAGAEAEMKANFSFGRGVPIPQAQDPEVQKVIDKAWKDPINKKKLTGFEAQRHRSNDLLTQANLFLAYFENNGRIRVAVGNADRYTDVVCHSEDDEMPLWYVSRRSKVKWNYDSDLINPWEDLEEGTLIKPEYHEHWRNVKIAEEAGLSFEGPAKSKIVPGKMEHFRINRIGRTQFGTPPWSRVMRFFSAMNQFTEARVSMAQAAASIIATNTVKGGPKGVLKAAGNILAQTGEIAAARFRTGSPKPTGPGTNPAVGQPPPPAGSIWDQNEASQLTAMNLSSGGAQAMSDRQMIAAPISAASQFGQHWLGDPSSTSMATATTLELPALMSIGAWQETFEEVFRFFTNRAIEVALKAGILGGMVAAEGAEADSRSLQDLTYEEDLEELEKRTGKDLSYSFEMPYPGRRNLPDVVNVTNAVATAYDPEGQNPWLRRKLLDFLFRHGLQTEDPARDVDDVMPLEEDATAPEHPLPPPEPEEPEEEGNGEGNGAAARKTKGVARDTRPNDEKSIRGEARKATKPTREMGGSAKESSIDDLIKETSADADREFDALLKDPASFLAGRPPAPTPESNGAAPAGTLG